MARNGSGTYNLPEAPFVYDTVIDEAAVNSNFSDIATALTGSLASDGQTNPTANLPMATYRHTGVGNASARNDYAAAGQVQDGSFIWCGTAGGSANALTLTPSPGITAYAAGQEFVAITGASPSNSTVTLAVSGLTATAVQINGAALSSTVTLEASKPYRFLYDGTQFQATRLSTDFSAVGRDILPSADSTHDLGSSSLAFAELHADKVVAGDGTAAAPALAFENDADCGFWRAGANEVGFSIAGVELYRAVAAGLVIGATSQEDGSYGLQVSGSMGVTSSVAGGMFCRHTGAGTQIVQTFRQGNPSSTVGTIEVVSGVSTNYNTTSDANLKEHLDYLDPEECARIVSEVKPRRFKWAVGEKVEMSGFFAQDFLDPYPEVVSSSKTPDKKPGDAGYDPVSLDMGKLVVPMWGALQSALKRIEQLENDMSQLSGDATGR